MPRCVVFCKRIKIIRINKIKGNEKGTATTETTNTETVKRTKDRMYTHKHAQTHRTYQSKLVKIKLNTIELSLHAPFISFGMVLGARLWYILWWFAAKVRQKLRR